VGKWLATMALVLSTFAGTLSLARADVASWYGAHHDGRLTASGCPFRAGGLTAASRTLPLGTRLRVTNLRNRRSIRVVITDRGPYHAGRSLDLSRAAADALGFTADGITAVRIEKLPGAKALVCHKGF
jgi:rare lipoprotein A